MTRYQSWLLAYCLTVGGLPLQAQETVTAPMAPVQAAEAHQQPPQVAVLPPISLTLLVSTVAMVPFGGSGVSGSSPQLAKAISARLSSIHKFRFMYSIFLMFLFINMYCYFCLCCHCNGGAKLQNMFDISVYCQKFFSSLRRAMLLVVVGFVVKYCKCAI